MKKIIIMVFMLTIATYIAEGATIATCGNIVGGGSTINLTADLTKGFADPELPCLAAGANKIVNGAGYSITIDSAACLGTPGACQAITAGNNVTIINITVIQQDSSQIITHIGDRLTIRNSTFTGTTLSSTGDLHIYNSTISSTLAYGGTIDGHYYNDVRFSDEIFDEITTGCPNATFINVTVGGSKRTYIANAQYFLEDVGTGALKSCNVSDGIFQNGNINADSFFRGANKINMTNITSSKEIRLNANNSLIENMVLTDDFFFQGTNTTLINITINDTTTTSITSTSNSTFNRMTFYTNPVTDATASNMRFLNSLFDEGFTLVSDYVNITNCTFYEDSSNNRGLSSTGNYTYITQSTVNNTDEGLYFDNVHNVTVNGTTVNWSDDYGIYANGYDFFLLNLQIDIGPTSAIGIYMNSFYSDVNNTRITNMDSHGLSILGSDYKLINNTIKDNDYGIQFAQDIVPSVIRDNILANNSVGIGGTYNKGTSYNQIYNNFLSNTLNADMGKSYTFWNVTARTGTRIFGSGPYIGGNYWTNNAGTGFSDNCADSDYDGFCDECYNRSDPVGIYGSDCNALAYTVGQSYGGSGGVTSPEGYMRYDNLQINVTTANVNQTAEFRVQALTTGATLGAIKFAHNMTGTWQNVSEFNYSRLYTGPQADSVSAVASQDGGFLNYTYDLTLDAAKGTEVCGIFWLLNLGGAFNYTEILCVNITNAIPVVDSINITPNSPESTDNLILKNYTADTDRDGISWEVKWYNNSKVITGLTNLTTITAPNLQTGEQWTASMKAFDGTNYSEWTNSSTVTLGDTTAPTVEFFRLSTLASYVNKPLTIYVNFSEANEMGNYVIVELTDPNEQKLNLSMSAIIDKYYSRTYTPVVSGTYFFKIFAEDGSHNAMTYTATINYYAEYVPPSGTGGGGGGTTIIETTVREEVDLNITGKQIQDICGNDICDAGETPLNCPNDCIKDVFNLEQIFCMPAFKCGNWQTSWFMNLTILGTLGFVVYASIRKNKKQSFRGTQKWQ